MDRRVPLPSGGYLVIDDTEAMTVIDVNSGRNVGKGGNRLEDTITKTNLEAPTEVVRQLRLRDIGGIVIIDFIDMDDETNRRAVKAALDEALARDRTRTYVVDISPLGLVEMTRQNISDGPREIMTEVCPTCGGVGVIASDETLAITVERELRESLSRRPGGGAVAVTVHPRVADVLTGEDGARLADLRPRSGSRSGSSATPASTPRPCACARSTTRSRPPRPAPRPAQRRAAAGLLPLRLSRAGRAVSPGAPSSTRGSRRAGGPRSPGPGSRARRPGPRWRRGPRARAPGPPARPATSARSRSSRSQVASARAIRRSTRSSSSRA